MQFGIQQLMFTFPGHEEPLFETVAQIAQTAEQAGFDSFWTMDHFYQLPGFGGPQQPILESWLTLTAVAARTSRLRLGTLVSCVAYRNPGVLANMGATLDVISQGRLIMGVGAGSNQQDFDTFGIPFLQVGARLRQLSETIHILHLLWTQDLATYQGRYFSIHDAFCTPKPVQQPRPPIMIGGSGERTTLRLVAQYADACNSWEDVPTVRHKVDVLRQHCEELGRDYSEVLTSCWRTVLIAEHDADLQRKLRDYCPADLVPEEFERRILAGTSAKVIDEVGRLQDAGIDYLIFAFPDAQDLESLRAFGEKVIPVFAGKNDRTWAPTAQLRLN